MINLLAVFNKKLKSKNYQQKHNNKQLITRIITDKEKKVSFIKIKIDDNNYNVLLDNGACQSVFDISALEIVKKVHPNIVPIGYDTLVTGFGDTQEVEIYEFPIIIDGWVYYIKASFANLGITEEIEKENNVKLIGVIGLDFFTEYKCLINYYNKKLYGIFNNQESRIVFK